MKPEKPITRKEMYLDVATGGSGELPSPVTREEKYLAKIAGESVDIPTPVTRYEMLLAAVAGESYTLTPVTRLEIYLAKAAGQDVEIPQPVTREEMYWFDYCGGTPTPPEREYTGAVPVTFIADGTPLLDYLISGNTVQSGTPTPDNPIMPEGTGERTGNLFDILTLENGIYLATNGNKYGNVTNGVRAGVKIKALPNTTYTFSAQSLANVSLRVFEWSSGTFTKQTPKYNISGSVSLTVTTTAETTEIAFNIEGENGQYATNIMFNLGSTPLPYEPYGYKLPFTNAGQTTNVYLGQTPTVRRVKKLVFDGSEPWVLSNEIVFINNTDAERLSPLICTHFPNAQNTGMWNGNNWIFQVNISTLGMTGREAWIAYLQQQYANGTPVTVWYVLATEETAVVNEPLMKIGEYADTVNMEQASVEIPTNNGSNTLDVLTAVKPSEVYIKYKGEPVAGSQTTLQSSAYAPAEVSGRSESIDDINNSLLGKEEETK